MFLIWLITTNLVNFAFYLAVTRVRFGWFKTVGFFLVGYVLPFLAFLFSAGLSTLDSERAMAHTFPYSFAMCCAIWGVTVLVMSRGSLGRRIFAVLVCGTHQVCAFSVGFLAMRRIEPGWVGDVLAILLMAGMGTLLTIYFIPRIHKMDDAAGWWELNLAAFLYFLLLYATGIWPNYVAAGGWRDITQFLVANIAIVFSFPLLLSFAGKNRAARLRRMLEDNTRIMQGDLRVARASEEGARRIRHDTRHHVELLRGLLQEGKSAEALGYLEHTFSHEVLLPPSNASWCENSLVNSILKIGQQRAMARGLGFRAEARVSAIIGIGEADLVALLSNLIENAVNGADGGMVRVSVVEDRGSLRIGVTNRVGMDFKLVNGLPCERPGVGIFSVRAEIEKYHGLFDYVLKGEELTARAMIGCGLG